MQTVEDLLTEVTMIANNNEPCLWQIKYYSDKDKMYYCIYFKIVKLQKKGDKPLTISFGNQASVRDCLEKVLNHLRNVWKLS